MEGIHVTHKASRVTSEDVISSLQDNVIANIMNHLPIRDAVRTSILAKSWRLKWTLLTQLVFDNEVSESLLTVGPKDKKYYDSRIISRLLHVLKGPVTKFVLYIRCDQILDIGDLNDWILFLSKKGVKELTLFNISHTPLMLPIHLFSCLELTHLKLGNCLFHSSPTFCGFPNLLSLDLWVVCFGGRKVGELITRCPSLETMEIVADYHRYPISRINLDDIAKLKNLKKLVLPLRELENRKIRTSDIFQFLGFLPKLEKLHLDFSLCRVGMEAVTMKFPKAFPCLNNLTLSGIDFSNRNMLSCVFGMIYGSSNLQELRVIMCPYDADEFDVPPNELFASDLNNNTMGQLQVKSVVIKHFRGSKNEENLIKYLLAYSPLLKRIAICSISSLDSNKKLRDVVKLLKLHRASPIAQVDFY